MEEQILRKEQSRNVNGNEETIINHIYHKKKFITEKELEELSNQYEDDYESAYLAGLAFDFNGDLVWIDLDKLKEALNEYLADSDNKDYFNYDIFKNLKENISKWKGFTVWL